MALENLVDGMTGLQMANTIKNNFDKVLDAESAENKAENAGKSIKTDYDATRYIELQLADGTPVKMKMDVFCQAIAPVVAEQMKSNKTIPGFQSFYKTIAAGETNVSLDLSGASGILFVYENISGHSLFVIVSSFTFAEGGFIKGSSSAGNLFSFDLAESGKIGINRTGINKAIVVSNNSSSDRKISGFFLKRS